MRAPLKVLTRRPKRSCATVTALCRLTAQGPFMPSSASRITSEGTPRIVEVIGATVTVLKCPIMLSRVKIKTGRSLSGEARRHRCTAPRFSLPATQPHPPRRGILRCAADVTSSRACPDLPIPVRANAPSAPAAPRGSGPIDSSFAASPPDRQLSKALRRGQPGLFPLWISFHIIAHNVTIVVCTRPIR
jgi:hypothetical protein